MAEFEGIRLQLFARRGGRNYMMRSEKRAGYNRPAPRKKPRKRRTRNGYLLLTLIVSILLWPLGLFLIWNRRLRCRAGGKVLWSAATLIAFAGLCIAILTIPTGSPKLQAFQDRANDGIATLRADAKILWETASERSGDAFDNMRHFAETTDDFFLNAVADGIDGGIALAQRTKDGAATLVARAKDFVEEALAPSPTPEPTAEPSSEPTLAASASPAAAATAASGVTGRPATIATPNPSTRPRATATPAASGTSSAPAFIGAVTTPSPAATPDDAIAVNAARAGLALARATQSAAPTKEPTKAPTQAPTPTPSPTATPTAKLTEKPTATPSPTPTAEPTSNPTATPVPTEKPTAVPTTTPIPTAAATPIPAQMSASGLGATLAIAPESTPGPALKPAGEFMVYHTARGKYYHVKEHCSGMLNASLHTLSSSVEEGFKSCPTCQAPAAELLSQTDILWADEAKSYHLTDACAQFSGAPSLMAFSDATEKAYTPCPICGAATYQAAT